MITTIVCPYCKKQVEITEALTHQIQEQVETDLKKEHEKQLLEIKEKTHESVKKDFEEKYKIETLDLKKQVEEKNKKVAEFIDRELKYREEMRKLEERDKERELEMQKKIDEEKKRIEEAVLKQAIEEHRLKDAEKDKKMADMEKLIEELKLKAKQGSQQTQGEVLELEMEQLLKKSFPTDEIQPVEKGVKGADIRQIVKTPRGNICGVILWESKRTKAWSDEWLVKLKDDLRAEKANVPVIVSSVLPKEVESGLGLKDGVWVCCFPLVIPLAEMVRQRLIDIARERYLSQNKGGKAEDLYAYITSHEFRQHVEAMAEIYKDMHSQIMREKTAFEKAWKIREAQVQKLFTTTARMIGDMQGKVGSSSMGQIKGLDMFELESGK